MKKALIIVVVVLAVLIALFYLLTPSHVRVERSTTIEAPAVVVFNQIGDLKNWEAWSPWKKIDPNMKITYGNQTSGKGAKNSWTSDNENVGAGALEIIEYQPPTKMRSQLTFGENGEMGGGTGSWDLSEADGKTTVTWGMDADLGMLPWNRFFGVMMDGMVGPSFETGLAGIKSISEKQHQDMEARKKEMEEMMKAKMDSAQAVQDSLAL